MEWPVNESPCDAEGCQRLDTTPCFYVVYSFDTPVFEALWRYGPRQAWRLWRDGHIDVLDGHYCTEHAYKLGFCWACGNFVAGSSKRFDLRVGGQWLCDSCWSNFQESEDEGYYPGPWDD
jgi:hypothetical protein